jgi:hypothetical protein
MGILDLDKVEGREIRKCISEITDFLYEESEGFNEWYMTLNNKEEKLLDDALFNILNRRLNKHKFGK